MAIGEISLGAGWRQQSVLAQTAAMRSPLDMRSEELASQMPLMNRSQYEPNKAGFGDGTVSVPTEAIYALGRNMKSVRKLVPSPEEARTKVQERISALREERLNAARAQREDVVVPRAVAGRNALALMNDINEAARKAKETTGGPDTASEGDGFLGRGDGETGGIRTLGRPLLDIFA